jgi:phosphatidylinositol alpha-1,6-mannosyltransferase
LGWHRVAKKVLADAKWIAEEAEALFQRPVATVPVGTDPERFRPDPVLRAELRKQYGFDSNDVVLLNVSALERAKGTWRVVEAVGRLRPRFPNLRYFILGRGDDEARLRAMVEGLGLSDIVIFGGTTSRLEAYYNMADIFVMLPDAEANSIACLEAMACGLPVVVANTGGFREVVTEQAGRLVDIHNPEAIDSAIAELARAPELRQAMGLAGRLIIQERLSWGHIAEQLMSIFKQELST